VSGETIVVMGVSGCGKSTVGTLVADRLGSVFVDGDSLHPLANVQKMAAGQALDDDDRAPWLALVGGVLARGDVVIACSALKRTYRDILRAAAPETVFVHLVGPPAVLASRMGQRSEHFMPTTLLDSQLATLEPLSPDERGFVVDIDASVESVVEESLAGLRPGASIDRY
jgi:carbohydrate kinase (thermoresistant glucokinase family)